MLPRERAVGVHVATGPTIFCWPGRMLNTKFPFTPGAETEVPATTVKYPVIGSVI
jgi:hypothetical protein